MAGYVRHCHLHSGYGESANILRKGRWPQWMTVGKNIERKDVGADQKKACQACCCPDHKLPNPLFAIPEAQHEHGGNQSW